VTYLAVLGFIVVGSVWLEWGLRTQVLRRWRRLLLAVALGTAPLLVWDFYAVAAGHWWFDEAQLLGPALPGGIPLEELLFFPVVAFAGILTLEAVRSVRQRPVGDEAPGGAPR
jgi:lycopene cyclase domain-containing protein